MDRGPGRAPNGIGHLMILCQNDAASSFWHNKDIIVMSGVGLHPVALIWNSPTVCICI